MTCFSSQSLFLVKRHCQHKNADQRPHPWGTNPPKKGIFSTRRRRDIYNYVIFTFNFLIFNYSLTAAAICLEHLRKIPRFAAPCFHYAPSSWSRRLTGSLPVLNVSASKMVFPTILSAVSTRTTTA